MNNTKFKNTNIGLIPEDWEVKTILESVTLKARIGWQGLTTAEYLNSGDYGLVTGTDFINGYIDWDNCVYVERFRYVQDKNIQLKNQDVLVTKDGTIGKVAFIDKLPNPTTLNSGVFVIRPKKENIDNKFFYYLLMSFYFDKFLAKITAGSTINHLYQKDFITFNFILPPLTEQKALATALSDTDALITSLTTLIDKKTAIKQGAMQELLRPKDGWDSCLLSEAVDFLDGQRRPIKSSERAKFSGTYPYYGASGIIDYVDNYIFDDELILLGEDGENILSRNLPLAFKVSGKIWVNNHAHVLKPKSHFNISFLCEYLESLDYSLLNSGTAQPKLNKSACSNMNIFHPSLQKQTRIATILSDMDNEIEKLETKLDKTKQIKQGMMQQLLTGKIRLL